MKGTIHVWTASRLLSLSPTGKVIRNVELRYPKGVKPSGKMFLFREG